MGPVKAPQRTYLPTTQNNPAKERDSSVIGDEGNIVGTRDDYQAIIQPREDSHSKVPLTNETKTKRRGKRKRIDDDLEEQYMQRLRIQGNDGNEKQQNESILREEDGTNGGSTVVRNPRGLASEKLEGGGSGGESDSEVESTSGEVETMDNSNPTSTGGISPDFPVRHEALEQRGSEHLETAARTVFLGNVPSIAISSKVRHFYRGTVYYITLTITCM